MGTPQKESFANRVRTAVKALAASGVECTVVNISLKVNIMNKVDNKRMLNALCDMVNGGELTRVRLGVYALRARSEAKPEICQVMWSLLHLRKLVTVDDLVEMASASHSYAQEWLTTLVRREVVRAEGKAYLLLKDSVEMPELTDNADKLRALREKKKQAVLAALDVASQALDKAKAALNEL